MATNGTGRTVAVLEEDFFFLGTINSALSKHGLEMVVVRPDQTLPAEPLGIILDLQWDGDWERLVTEQSARGVECVAFGSHVATDLLKRARQAGCSRVLAKSKFVQVIGDIAEKWAARPAVSLG